MPKIDEHKRKQTEPASTPNVIVDVLFESGLFFISVENIGFLPAHKIRITFDQPILGIDGKPINDLNLFNHLEYLPPGKQLTCFLNRADLYFQSDAPAQFAVTVDFQDDREQEFQNQIRHNLSIYEDINIVTEVRTAVPSKAEIAPEKPPEPGRSDSPGSSIAGLAGRQPPGSWKEIAASNAIDSVRRSNPITLRNRSDD